MKLYIDFEEMVDEKRTYLIVKAEYETELRDGSGHPFWITNSDTLVKTGEEAVDMIKKIEAMFTEVGA